MADKGGKCGSSGMNKNRPEVHGDQLGENASEVYRSDQYSNAPDIKKGKKK